jgi:hypothetical protein
MVTLVCVVTALVLILNFGDVRLPAGTVIVGGTLASPGRELVRDMVRPPLGAGAFNVTVSPPTVLPPRTPDWERFTAAGANGFTVTVEDTATPPYVAVMVIGVLVLTAAVDILNAADVIEPALTLTVEGTAAMAGLLLESFTFAPAGGEGDTRVTVFPALGAVPPTRDAGKRFTEAAPSGITVRVALTLTPENVAVIVTGVLAAT